MNIIATTSHRCDNVYRHAGWVLTKRHLEITPEVQIASDVFFSVGAGSII
jgi:hypothetical protein